MQLLIHTANGQPTEVDPADVLVIGIEEDGGPLFKLRVDADRSAVKIHSTRAMRTMLVWPLASNGIEVRADNG